MSRMLPEYTETELVEATGRSWAERDVYERLRSLPGDRTCLHSHLLLKKNRNGVLREGEADFVVLDPARGILVIEVKGGAVHYDGLKKRWSAVDRDGSRRPFTGSGPVTQARQRMFDVRTQFQESLEWRSLGQKPPLFGHAVLFPAVEDMTPIRLSHGASPMFGGTKDLKEIGGWLDSVFEFFSARDAGSWAALGDAGVATALEVLCPSFALRAPLSARVGYEQTRQAHWTDTQWAAFGAIRRSKQVRVVGGAGTGKSVLAWRRAWELAVGGRAVLLLCFNTALADSFRRQRDRLGRYDPAAAKLLTTTSITEFAGKYVRKVSKSRGLDLGEQARRDTGLPPHHPSCRAQALALAVEEEPPRFDAILVDEAQDIDDDYWIPIELMDPPILLAAFYDPNQQLRAGVSDGCPIPEDRVYELDRNCRNTGEIHTAAYRYYTGPRVMHPEPEGVSVAEWAVDGSLEVQAQRCASEVSRLINQDGLAPEQVAVLVVDSTKKQLAYEALNEAFTASGATPPPVEHHGGAGFPTVDTVARFKGLEATAVVVWLNGPPSDALLYVAMSRARSLLALLGTAVDIRWALRIGVSGK